jgi:DHA3 family tetracycline resistance protein-like MFS transporter
MNLARNLARLAAARPLQPLRNRDFALLVGGSVVSLLGDGFFFVALTWQVYTISNVPTALSLVGAAGTLPSVVFLLIGGTFSDRYDRRHLMIGADLLRGAALAVMAGLSASGAIELWHVAVLMGVVGIGGAFFNPASSAIVPDLVPDEQLGAANALSGMYRPLMIRMIGPALAGIVVAAAGPAPAFAIDGASFLASALAVSAIRARPPSSRVTDRGVRATVVQIGEGLRFALANPWIWATLVSAMLSLLVFIGPVEVLVPYLVKNRLELGPEALGAIFATGGLGSVAMAVAIGFLGLPRRRITVMYVAWSGGVAVIALYGLMTELWQGLAIAFALQASFQLGQVIWTTLLQQLVPRHLLGRISSLDWLVSTGLVPVSFALTGPVSDVLGPESTVLWAGLVGAVLMGFLLFVPGVRDPERTSGGATAGLRTGPVS